LKELEAIGETALKDRPLTQPPVRQLSLPQSLQLAAKKIDAGQLPSAQAILQSILQQHPQSAEALHLMGVLAHKTGKPRIAVDLIGKAIEIRPDVAQFHSNRGEMCRLLGRLNEAIRHGEQAIKLSPNQALAHSNLGIAYFDIRNLDRAAACQHNALLIDPEFTQALNNLGSIKKEQKDFDGAIACFRRLLALVPDHAEALNNLGQALLDAGQLADAVESHRRALEINRDYTDSHSNLLFALNYTASHSPAYYLEQACEFGRRVSGRIPARFSSWIAPATPDRLRIGLISGDLRNHSVGHFLEGLFTNIDPARVELNAYPTRNSEDELTRRIRPRFSAWKPIQGMSDENAARMIHADGIHTLLDLSGHTALNRLPVFAWKPAPVQVTWLGLPATSGMAEMDYVLADPHALPAGHENHFLETVWRMPETYLCLTAPDSPVKVAPLPAFSSQEVTFGSFNNLSKMNDTVVTVWSRILKAVPDSRLLLKTKQLNDPVLCEKTCQRFAAHGISPDRLMLNGILDSSDEHLDTYNKVDIALDTFPYPGITTSLEALWMGVPVLCMRGDRLLHNTSASIAHNAGLADWLAADEDEFVSKAVAYANNLEHLASLRAGLRQQVLSSPLFDTPRFARNFEDALWGMWQHHQTRQQRPA